MLKKEWFKEKLRKGNSWIKKNQGAINFGLGMATMTGIYLLAEKIDEPKTGSIVIAKDCASNHVLGDVFYENRFGTNKRLITIDYGMAGKETENKLKSFCDGLNEIIYPGD